MLRTTPESEITFKLIKNLVENSIAKDKCSIENSYLVVNINHIQFSLKETNVPIPIMYEVSDKIVTVILPHQFYAQANYETKHNFIELLMCFKKTLQAPCIDAFLTKEEEAAKEVEREAKLDVKNYKQKNIVAANYEIVGITATHRQFMSIDDSLYFENNDIKKQFDDLAENCFEKINQNSAM